MANKEQSQTIEDTGTGSGSDSWTVEVFNNDTNTYDEVIAILMKATGCNKAEAETETWEIHHLGKALVHFSSQSECERVAAVIATIGVQAVARPEWED